MTNQNYYKICPTCTYFCHIEEDDEYCALCGTELISKCPNCKKGINYPHGHYCKYCGHQFREIKKEENKHKKGSDSGYNF